MLTILLICSILVISIGTVSATADTTLQTCSTDISTPTDVSNTQTTTSEITDTTDNQTTNQTKSNETQAAGDPPVMKGYWMRYDDVASDPNTLKNRGITDIFFLTRGADGAYHYNELQWAINKYRPYGIKVHAWIVCFKDDNHFVNPSGYYCYTAKIYVKTTKRWGWKKVKYKVKKKVRYKVRYKYRNKWKYKWKYKRVYVTRYKWKRGWIYTPVYKYETRTGYDASYNTRLINEISGINSNYAVDGIHLDYVRYSGVAEYGNAAWQQPGGVAAAVDAVTGFVQKVRGVVTKQLSAAVMPEGNVNDDYYAQDYDRLADYLDFLVPMTYEGNYGANNGWIKQMTQYIVDRALDANGNKIPVYAGLTTYYSDSNLRALTPGELQADVTSAKDGGASGFVLFRYGFGCSFVPSWT